ncbi:hypothetical protein BD408DRAFT_404903 [Parasitella parasitica]|nr:hypothetical protein BD408DRAFT_404903 [Parasitella parasitica]
MSDLSSGSIDGIAFNERTTSASFQERLLQAKSDTEFEPLDYDTRFVGSYESYDTAELKKLLEDLTNKVLYMENRVIEKENKLTARKAERNVEAGIANMTTEERAAYVEQEEERQLRVKKTRQDLRKRLLGKMPRKQDRIYIDGDKDKDKDEDQDKDKDKDEDEEMEKEEGSEKSPDTDEEEEDREEDERKDKDQDSEEEEKEDEDEDEDDDDDNKLSSEYLLLLESESIDDHMSFGADFMNPDFINPNAQVRQKAFASEQVTRQTDYSGIVIKQSAYSFKENSEAGTESVRHCALSGTSFDLPFQAEFDVLEPSMVMSSLNFEVNIEMQLAVGTTLQKIKDECNIMGFFRLFVHYAQLEKQRDDVFNRLTQHYKDTSVNIVMLSHTKLQFEGAVDCGINLLLSWKITETNTDREKLDANVVNDVRPNLTMEAVALSAVITRDTNGALDKVNEAFLHTIMQKGVYEGTKYIVDNILSVEQE